MSPGANSVLIAVVALVSSVSASKLCYYKPFANSVTCNRGYRTVLSSFDSNFHWIVHHIFAEDLLKEKHM